MTHDQTTPAPVEVRDTRLTRPIVGIKNRTAQEVFDIMCDRIAHSAPAGQVEPVAWMYTHGSTDHKIPYLTMERDERFAALADTIETPLYTHPALPADLVELVEAADTPLVGAWMLLEHKVLAATGALSDSEWRPDRSHIEGMQRTMQQAIEEIAQARAALAKHGGA